MMSSLIVVVVFSILIVVHEWGHFIAAKRVGVQVQKFSIGFGKKLFSFMHQGTEFMVCAIPLGGYVKLAGDDREECKGESGEFFSHPVGHRALIVAMGPIVNFIFAYLCFYFVFMTGFPVFLPNVGKILDGPAQVAGIREGDRIVRIDDQRIESWDDIPQHVLASEGRTLRFAIDREGEAIIKMIAPQRKVLKNIFGEEKERWIIGIQPSGETAMIRYGPGESFVKSAVHLSRIVTMTFSALYRVITGAMPAKDALAGPIVIFDVIKEAAALGIAHLVLTMAIISASLAIINLFPIPVLDGGHLLFLLIEKIRHKPVSTKVEERMVKLGFSLLVCLMVFVMYNDIVKMGWISAVKGFLSNFRS